MVHEAVPAEDRMQAFPVAASRSREGLEGLVLDPSTRPPPKRVRAPAAAAAAIKTSGCHRGLCAAKPKFTKQQVARTPATAQAALRRRDFSPKISTTRKLRSWTPLAEVQAYGLNAYAIA